MDMSLIPPTSWLRKVRVKAVSTGIKGVSTDDASIEKQYDLQGRAYDKDAKIQGVSIMQQRKNGKAIVKKVVKPWRSLANFPENVRSKQWNARSVVRNGHSVVWNVHSVLRNGEFAL